MGTTTLFRTSILTHPNIAAMSRPLDYHMITLKNATYSSQPQLLFQLFLLLKTCPVKKHTTLVYPPQQTIAFNSAQPEKQRSVPAPLARKCNESGRLDRWLCALLEGAGPVLSISEGVSNVVVLQ